MPMAEADAPKISPPIDHKPRSIKKKLKTRPNKCAGVAACSAVFTEARKAIKQKPTANNRNSDSVKNLDRANRARKIAYPNTHAPTQKRLGLALPMEASHKPATVAPTPGADINKPKPDAPTCKILVAKTGTKVTYGAPIMATT